MSGEACPLSGDPTEREEESIRNMLGMRRIAVVGISDRPSRPSHYVSAYLREHGHEIVPVNPAVEEVFGQKCNKSLAEVKGGVDMVLVFRRSEFCAGVAEEAREAGAKGIWLQSGIVSEEARKIAEEAGMEYVEDRCMMMEAMRRGRGG
jgi:predicted CoA-binding protein